MAASPRFVYDSTGVSIVGLEALVAKLRDLGAHKEIERISFDGTKRAARIVRELAKDNARINFHERTGNLIKNIRMSRQRQGAFRGYSVGVKQNRKDKNSPYYWWMLEFGTRRMPKRSFLGLAYRQYANSARENIVADSLKEVYKSAERTLRRRGVQ
jgi:HK97 gp10 family phage protein